MVRPPIRLANDRLQVEVSPDLGASVMGLRAAVGGRWIPLMPEPGTPGVELAAASFVMAPYSNRIAGGRFPFGGRVHQLRNADNHAMHGDVRKRPWAVLATTGTTARLGFVSRDFPDVNWPWDFDLDLVYELAGSTFSSVLTLTNRAGAAMPAGFGFHPYFSRVLTRAGEPVLAQFTVRDVYPDAWGTRIPSGPARPPSVEQDHSVARELDPAAFHDFCGTGHDGRASIRWPESGVGVTFRAGPTLDHFVFFNPPKPYFAMEPVSNANDGVNLLARGDPTSGVRVLEPGEALVGELHLDVAVPDVGAR